jgi:outer membrane protein assembly factor BamA
MKRFLLSGFLLSIFLSGLTAQEVPSPAGSKVKPAAAADSTIWNVRKIEVTGLASAREARRMARSLDNVQDSTGLMRRLESWISGKAGKGHLEFATDTFWIHRDSLFVRVFEGPHYQYGDIRLAGLNEIYLQKAGIERLLRKHAPVNWQDLNMRLGYCMNAYEEKGYPFAAFRDLEVGYSRIGEDSIQTDIAYSFDPGPLVRIDSIRIVGKKREKDRFVHTLMRVSPGETYRQDFIDNIPRLLNNSIYYKNVPEPEISFTSPQTANLKIRVEPRRTGKFDLLVGLIPPPDNSQKFQFTVLADFVFVSPFRFGEIIQFKYQKLPGSSQLLDIQYIQPYLLQTPLQVEAGLNILKQDTSFLNRKFFLSGQYTFSPFLSTRIYFHDKSSTLLDVSGFLADTTRIPPVLDGTNRIYGLGFRFENLDYRLSPTRGFQIDADFGIGKRIVRENPKLWKSLYQQVELNQPVRELDFAIHYYKQLFRRQVVHLANQTYWLGQQQYFENDMLQVGGSRSIRGFNENEFFVNFYSFFTLEYRLLLDRNSFIFVFGDYAFLENAVAESKSLRPLGIGLGMNYETKAGIISISYAVGKVGEQSFQPARGKVHIGLINQF